MSRMKGMIRARSSSGQGWRALEACELLERDRDDRIYALSKHLLSIRYDLIYGLGVWAGQDSVAISRLGIIRLKPSI